ncbi:HTH-10 family transcription regulator (plasmid) [Natrialba magadii ATCC 43099]|uniref:Bacterio-opsin activator HTH domain-containing protein n=1 Tax=Natrialba magadii (strain ATCC 43099 / DSM 3394 / CCM 3739 / CIP 104546 / IAM 13178 / JCM 8861 / NBRC 102185 / NCIMB 2190 / MS3) TaxID=547559 RepID=D3T1X2_NATMM|nr:helix-turn-helix domain-containing protein [Natrialba magadii]ADD07581.1 HTH-10 family transcription regulator [Natrialba magadii ATCC 43099]ELY27221.1 bacterio-opsin activator HTH domain-containing protein [Natrialba magadii ATCC 43099]
MSMQQSVSCLRLTLDLWHPGCWAIDATGRADGGILAHTVYTSPHGRGSHSSTANGLFTAFGDTSQQIQDVLDAVRDSSQTVQVHELQEQFGHERDVPANIAREFFLEYDPGEMVCPVLLENGFVHRTPIRIQDGIEEWNLCFIGDRSRVTDALDDVRKQADAEVTVTSITTAEAADHTSRSQRLDTLTPAQRKVFEHARNAGYYEWPRKTTTRELADDLDIAKSTLLEHLRVAESKLLDP